MTITADNLNRTKKLLLDSGEVTDLEALDAAYAKYGMVLQFERSEAQTFQAQLSLLTILNLAARCTDGQVELRGPLDIMLVVPGFAGSTLAEAAAQCGAKEDYRCGANAPVLGLGAATNAITPAAAGWRAAVIGIGCRSPFEPGTAQPLAIVAASALAVSEAFNVLRNDHPLAGKRVMGLNLWSPSLRTRWQEAEADGPEVVSVSAPILIAGLGHLGQAYVWGLAMQLQGSELPELWLLDDDWLTESTWSTSMLTPKAYVRQRKTRLVAGLVEKFGFAARLVEQRLLKVEQFTDETPKLVLFGVDNPAARRLISRLPAMVVVEAGLGDRHDSFRKIRVHGFPQSGDSAAIWADRHGVAASVSDQRVAAIEPKLAPAYRKMLDQTKDQCGTTTLASKSVGVPFVGCFAACLVLSEFFRRLSGGTCQEVQEVDLRDLADRELA